MNHKEIFETTRNEYVEPDGIPAGSIGQMKKDTIQT